MLGWKVFSVEQRKQAKIRWNVSDYVVIKYWRNEHVYTVDNSEEIVVLTVL